MFGLSLAFVAFHPTAGAQAAPCDPLIVSAVAYDDDGLVLPVLHGPVSVRVDNEPRSVRDGDFLLSAPGRGGAFYGDDESVSWVFNLAGENGPTWTPIASSSPPLTQATLWLEFTPVNTGVTSDTIAILGLPATDEPLRPWILTGEPGPVDLTRTYAIEVDLLAHYAAADLAAAALEPSPGRLSMIFEDDSRVESAKIELTFDPCGY